MFHIFSNKNSVFSKYISEYIQWSLYKKLLVHCFMIIYTSFFWKDVLQNIEVIFICPFVLHKLTLIASLMEAVTQRVAESARRHSHRPLSFGSRVPSSTFFLKARPMTARPPGSFEIIGALRYLLIIILCFAEALQNEAARNTVEVIYVW